MFTIIVGGGQVGAYLAKLLLAEKHQLKIVDRGESGWRCCSASCLPN